MADAVAMARAVSKKISEGPEGFVTRVEFMGLVQACVIAAAIINTMEQESHE